MMSKRMKNMRVLLLMILAVFSLSVSAQTITATGNVKDATGDPIIGASIVEKGNTSNCIGSKSVFPTPASVNGSVLKPSPIAKRW